jgi:vitamin B12 transporter
MRKSILLSFAILSLPCAVSAADLTTGNNLETVVVSATRTEQPREITGSSLSVITAADLAAEQITVMTDALKETPGLTVVRNGGAGQITTIGIRGAEAGQTLVLIDGVRINDPSTTDGEALLADLFVANTDRIEILRGPQSTLYGSDAIGGVVNILTKRGGATPFSAIATAEGGSLGTYRLNAAANGTVDAVEYGGAINFYNTQGIAAADSRPLNVNPDPYRNLSASGNIRVHVTDAVSFDLRGYSVNARTVFDGFPPPNFTLQYTGEYGTDDLLAYYAGLNISLLDGKFRNRIAATDLDSDRKNYNPALSLPEEFFAGGRATTFEYQGVFDITAANQIVFGAESQRTALRSGSPSVSDPNPTPVVGHTQINSYYAQYQTTLFEQLTLTGGIRHDDDESFGGHNSIKFAAAWSLFGSSTIVRGNYGDGFKAPSLYELFSPYSNPVKTLAPETARGWETGIDQKLFDGRALASIVYFRRRTDNQIDFFGCFGVVSAACTQRPFGYYDNINRAQAEGIELEASAQIFQTLAISGNVADMGAIDLATRQDLARRPRLIANARIVWTPDAAWSLGAGAGYTGRRFDDDSERVPLASFIAVNIFASYALTDHIQLFGRAENIFDSHYELAAGYRSLPMTLTAGLRVTL